MVNVTITFREQEDTEMKMEVTESQLSKFPEVDADYWEKQF